MTFKELAAQLEIKITTSVNEGIEVSKAENLAGEFLIAQMVTSTELKKADLDSRMRKTGLKAVKAAVYMSEATKGEKKPSDVMLQALVDLSDAVTEEQNALDAAEVERDDLERHYNIFQQAHVHFRQISKGSMG